MKNPSVLISMFLSLALPAVASAAGSEAVFQAPEDGRAALYVEGPSEGTTDVANKTTFSVPGGWFAVVPNPPAELIDKVTAASTTLANYDIDRSHSTGLEHSSHEMHESMIKIDVTTRAAEGRTLEERVKAMRVPNADLPYNKFMLSDTIPVDLAGHKGYAYRASTDHGDVAIVALDWTPKKTLVASLKMGRTDQLEEALRVLDTVRGEGEPYLPTKSDLRGIADQLSALGLEQSKSLPLKSGYCTHWTGTDTGWYAPNSPIGLNLPFYWGTRWMAGGWGAYFWGNKTHGNCNNDYFAIDFNRANSSCTGYLGDEGYYVYPAQNGTAYTGWDEYGYGNYINVQHPNGIRTRYAHLKDIYISYGQWVNASTIMGTVGTTGNSTGPHLHFGFYQNGYSRCARSGGCPNGEASSWPNSPKPNAMFTDQGWKTMADGQCYIAPWR